MGRFTGLYRGGPFKVFVGFLGCVNLGFLRACMQQSQVHVGGLDVAVSVGPHQVGVWVALSVGFAFLRFSKCSGHFHACIVWLGFLLRRFQGRLYTQAFGLVLAVWHFMQATPSLSRFHRRPMIVSGWLGWNCLCPLVQASGHLIRTWFWLYL